MASNLLITANNVPNNTTNASFRAWAQMISNSFATAGFSKDANVTGQIDFTTVTAPATTGSNSVGFEVWRFTDTLQATNPICFKVEYGSGPNGPITPGIWFTFGSNCNSSGGIATTPNTPRILASNSLPQAVNVTSWLCGSNGRWCAALWAAVANNNTSAPYVVQTTYPVAIGFERTKDAAGADTAAGLLITMQTGSGLFSQICMGNSALGSVAYETSLGFLTPGAGPSVSGSRSQPVYPDQYGLYPQFHSYKGTFLNPGLNFLLRYDMLPVADMVGNIIPAQIYGSTHYYVGFGTAAFTGSVVLTGRSIASLPGSAASLLFRFE